jgi:hypothetical protein
MLFNRKGQGMPLNTIIIAIIVIVVLVVIILIFTGQIRIFGDTTEEARNECQRAFGMCVTGADANAACQTRGLTPHTSQPAGCPTEHYCCVVG